MVSIVSEMVRCMVVELTPSQTISIENIPIPTTSRSRHSPIGTNRMIKLHVTNVHPILLPNEFPSVSTVRHDNRNSISRFNFGWYTPLNFLYDQILVSYGTANPCLAFRFYAFMRPRNDVWTMTFRSVKLLLSSKAKASTPEMRISTAHFEQHIRRSIPGDGNDHQTSSVPFILIVSIIAHQ